MRIESADARDSSPVQQPLKEGLVSYLFDPGEFPLNDLFQVREFHFRLRQLIIKAVGAHVQIDSRNPVSPDRIIRL